MKSSGRAKKVAGANGSVRAISGIPIFLALEGDDEVRAVTCSCGSSPTGPLKFLRDRGVAQRLSVEIDQMQPDAVLDLAFP
jgi:hypothetical protein